MRHRCNLRRPLRLADERAVPPIGDSEPNDVRAALAWLREHVLSTAQLRTDSRSVRPGDVFIALPGRRTDGSLYVEQARQQGAAAMLLDADAQRAPTQHLPPVLALPKLRGVLAPLAAAFYDHPSASLQAIGITGTNGKTTCCQWIGQILTVLGRPCATIGTLGFAMPGTAAQEEVGLTTPDAVNLQRLARQARDLGAGALALEVSSIGIDQGRVDAMKFAVALFTNLSRDHLDYHADMQAYGAAKRRLFLWPGLRHAVMNLDDDFGRDLARELAAGGTLVTGYGAHAETSVPGLACRLQAEHIEHHARGVRLCLVCERGGAREFAQISASVLGEFNVQNLLGVIGVALACGFSLAPAAAAAGRLQAPPGRLQQVIAGENVPGPLAIVDYAHTPDAIAKALAALRPLADARQGKLWIVFGAGGDRDPGKRPAMAAAAAGADVLLLTSDNPRGENADAIIDQVAAGVPAGMAFRRETDRAVAIDQALRAADPADVVLIAGKGHENYQEIAGRRLPFSDHDQARAALRARSGLPA